ncbi:hypothetical protein [Burkholderia sp. LMG 13014]|uniref:hypothetical protein n=1 Tax=Burkholderia sp. LMG 13014 TaxID=2709306 RepID=UPI001965E536|nr:hypothetical protein [Burkholderia sp. LMG 13014]
MQTIVSAIALLLLALIIGACNVGAFRLTNRLRWPKSSGARAYAGQAARNLGNGIGTLALIGVAGCAWLAMAALLNLSPWLQEHGVAVFAVVLGVLNAGILVWRLVAWDI